MADYHIVRPTSRVSRRKRGVNAGQSVAQMRGMPSEPWMSRHRSQPLRQDTRASAQQKTTNDRKESKNASSRQGKVAASSSHQNKTGTRSICQKKEKAAKIW